jgi:hypothetical protein
LSYVTAFVTQGQDVIEPLAFHRYPAFLEAIASNMMQDDQNYLPKLDPMAQDILEEDRKFLNDLLQKQNQDEYREGNSFCAPVQYIGKMGQLTQSVFSPEGRVGLQ